MIYRGEAMENMGKIFRKALDIAENHPEEAKEFLTEYANAIRDANPLMSEEEATKAALNNLGYFAGYYNSDTRDKISKVYGAVHPIFGNTI